MCARTHTQIHTADGRVRQDTETDRPPDDRYPTLWPWKYQSNIGIAFAEYACFDTGEHTSQCTQVCVLSGSSYVHAHAHTHLSWRMSGIVIKPLGQPMCQQFVGAACFQKTNKFGVFKMINLCHRCNEDTWLSAYSIWSMSVFMCVVIVLVVIMMMTRVRT